jgi:beta-lactamase regulating signal transducer with metallopeptidase domain
MGIGTSIVLIAVGAILKWAVTATVSGVSIATIGTILLIVGILGLIISLLMTANAFGPRDRTVVRERYVDEPRA